MVDQLIHDERKMLIMALIPFWPLQLYAFFMIEKARKFGLALLGIFAISISVQMVLPFPYGLVFALAASMSISGYLMKKWVKQWNAKFSSVS